MNKAEKIDKHHQIPLSLGEGLGVRSGSILLCLLLLLCLPSFSQKISEDLIKVREAYRNAKYLSMQVQVTSYASEKDTKGELVGTGVMYAAGINYYSKFMSDELLVNEDASIMVDHDEKTITYVKGSNKNAKQKTGSPMQAADLDSLLQQTDSVAYRGEVNGKKLYSFYDPTDMISRTDIYIDPATWLISKITYYYNANVDEDEEIDLGAYKTTVEYKNVSTLPFKENEVFSEKKIVSRKGRNILPAAAYTGYKLKVMEKEKPKLN